MPAEEEITAEDSQPDMNTSGAEFQEADLPADFPPTFPLPENTRVASVTSLPGDQSYRVFLSFPGSTLEDLLAFYAAELEGSGWTVIAEGPDLMGYGLVISNPDHDAKLSFLEDEFGAVLDLTLVPLGELEELPGADSSFGESEGLGESGGDFPEDFPVAGQFTAIDLPAKLAGEGYQLAFSYPGLAELAIVEFSTALMGGSWSIGDFQADAVGGYYILPFTGPGGFEGYALITSSPGVAGLPAVSGAVIALHEGAAP